MKKCKYCQSKIDEAAKVCKYCRHRQDNLHLKIITIIVIILAIVGLFIIFKKGEEEYNKITGHSCIYNLKILG